MTLLESLNIEKARAQDLRNQLGSEWIVTKAAPPSSKPGESNTLKEQIGHWQSYNNALRAELRAKGVEPKELSPVDVLGKAAFQSTQNPAPAPAPAAAPPPVEATALDKARGLLADYHGKTGGAKTAFFREHETALMAAEEAVLKADGPPPKRTSPDAFLDKSPFAAKAHAAAPGTAQLADARALLAEYGSLRGRDKTAFFRANEAALFAAGSLLESAE